MLAPILKSLTSNESAVVKKDPFAFADQIVE